MNAGWLLACLIWGFVAGTVFGVTYVNNSWKVFWKYWIWHEHTWVDGCRCGKCCEVEKAVEGQKSGKQYRYCASCGRTEYREYNAIRDTWWSWQYDPNCK